MINKISAKLIQKLLGSMDDIKQSEQIYVYGMEILLSTVIEIFTILFSAMLFSVFNEAILFLFIFISLRIFTGGYHANTYRKCFFITVSSYWITLLINYLTIGWEVTNILYQFLPVICIYIVVRAPVVNKNQPLNELRKTKNSKMTMIMLIVELLLINSLVYNKYYMNMAILTVYAVASFMMIADYIERRRKV